MLDWLGSRSFANLAAPSQDGASEESMISSEEVAEAADQSGAEGAVPDAVDGGRPAP